MIRENLDHVLTLWRSGRHHAARQAAVAAVEAYPDDGQVWLLYGKLLVALGETVAAQGALTVAVDLLPASTEATCALAGVQVALGRWHDALDRLAAVLASEPEHERAVQLLGEVVDQHADEPLPPSASVALAAPLAEIGRRFAQQKLWHQAVFAARLALSTRPESVRLINDLGCLLQLWMADDPPSLRVRLAAVHEVMHVFLGVIAKDPDFAPCYRNLASLFANLASRDVKGASRAADYCAMRAFELTPGDRACRIAAADVLFSRRRLKDAAAAHCGEWEWDGSVVSVSALTDFVVVFDRIMDGFYRADRLPAGPERRAAMMEVGDNFRALGIHNEAALMFGVGLRENPGDPYLRGRVGELVAARWLLHQAVGLSMGDFEIGPPPLVMEWPRRPLGAFCKGGS